MKFVALNRIIRDLSSAGRRHALRKGSFGRDVLTLMMGTTFAEGLGIAAAPILTRLYTPQDFGVLALFVTITSILAVIVSWRYELAIMFPESDEEAGSVLMLAMLIALGMASLMFLIVLFFRHQIAHWLGADELAMWLWWAPASLLLSATYQAGNFWFTRKKRFGRPAISRVSQASVTVGGQITTGALASPGPVGLIASSIAGQTAASGALAVQIWKEDRKMLARSSRWDLMKQSLVRFKNFPLYSAPYSLVGGLSKQVLVLLLGVFSSTSVVGLFAVARKLTYLPINLLSYSMNQVFFQRVATADESGNLEGFINKTMRLFVIVGTPILVLFLWHVRWLVGVAFGGKWMDVSPFASLLAIASFMSLLHSWMDRIYDVKERQGLALAMELVYDVIFIGLFVAVLYWFKNVVWAVGIYVGITVLDNIIWLIVTFRLANFALQGLAKIGAVFLLAAGISVLWLWLTDLACHHVLGTGNFSIIFSIGIYLLGIGLAWAGTLSVMNRGRKTP